MVPQTYNDKNTVIDRLTRLRRNRGTSTHEKDRRGPRKNNVSYFTDIIKKGLRIDPTFDLTCSTYSNLTRSDWSYTPVRLISEIKRRDSVFDGQ